MITPPMPYAGGKQAIAARIVSLLPPHTHYVEPYAGALSVLLAKPPSLIETVNDLDGAIVTFWRVLRDRPADLERVCALTPHAREEMQRARDLDADDDLERARRVWVLLTQNRGARLSRSGWRFVHGGSRRSLAAYLDGYLQRIAPAAERLRSVSIEHRDALDMIDAYDQPGACFYVDPPYLGAVRGPDRIYRHELMTDVEHEQLLGRLLATRSAVVVSGYANPLYDEALQQWARYELAATAMTGSARVEVVWTNTPSCQRDTTAWRHAR